MNALSDYSQLSGTLPSGIPHILSLGAGVQSSCLALMAAKGEVGPMPSAAVFADTQAEPASVYLWLDWLEKQLPFPVHRVTAGSLTEKSLRIVHRKARNAAGVQGLIPAFTLNNDGSSGILGRACTADFKIMPLLKKARAIGGIGRGQKTVGIVQWIGISLDEAHRMKPSPRVWAANRWPLVDMRMSRHDCLRWMERNGYPKPPRSACVYCPFHSDYEWRRLRAEEPDEFNKAVQFEHNLQSAYSQDLNRRGKPFLHSSLKPLAQVDFSTEEDRGQGSLFGNDCTGMCGV